MGEAKRRAKLNPRYGKFINISSQLIFEQQLEKLLEEYINSDRISHIKNALRCKQNIEEDDLLNTLIGSWLAEKIQLFAPEDREKIAGGLAMALVFPSDDPIGDAIKECDSVSDLCTMVCLLRLHAIAIRPYIQKPEAIQIFENLIQVSKELLDEIGSSDENEWRKADNFIKSIKSSSEITAVKNSK